VSSIFNWLKSKVNDEYKFERAPEPSDVFWENLKVSSAYRAYSMIATYFVTILIIGVSFGIIYGISFA
jgi:hypothetical protein